MARALEASSDHEVIIIGAWNRTFARALETSLLLEAEVSAGDALPETFCKADVVLMAVVDDAVVATASLLAPHLRAKQCLLHTSGSLPSTVMMVPGMQAQLGGCHPLQALAAPEGSPDKLAGSTFAIEGHQPGLDAARALALSVGGRPVEISTAGKAAYHAAAVVSANYLTVLVDAACDLMAQAGVDAATSVDMLLPLLQGTLDNLATSNQGAEDGRVAIAQSLTGPARRGDAGTINAHQRALRRCEDEDLRRLYHLLTERAADIVARLDSDAAGRVRSANSQ